MKATKWSSVKYNLFRITDFMLISTDGSKIALPYYFPHICWIIRFLSICLIFPYLPRQTLGPRMMKESNPGLCFTCFRNINKVSVSL